ncbi:MAG TPA: type I-E CRISPR-associated protein Cas5/CasD [Gemmatimonadaceae bacterium]
MIDFLLFTLYAPLASWGEIAVGEARGSWDRPSRSAVLGLVAAALGITRGDQAAHEALDTGYGVAVRLDASGAPLVDYHTAQTVAASVARKRKPATRAELLAAGERETILSRRGYRQDALATVALWARRGARWPLDELATAMRRPAFVLYAGRKANALGLPLSPSITSAETLADAFMGRAPTITEPVARAVCPPGGWGREVAHDPCETFASGLRPLRRDTRRDSSPQRARWQFAERVVEVGELAVPAAGGARGEGISGVVA